MSKVSSAPALMLEYSPVVVAIIALALYPLYCFVCPTASGLPVVNRKRPWELFSTSAKRRFLCDSAELIREGRSSNTAAFYIMTDMGPRLLLSGEHAEHFEDSSKFNTFPIRNEELLLNIPGLEVNIGAGSWHNHAMNGAVAAMTRKLAGVTAYSIPALEKEASEAVAALLPSDSADSWHDVCLYDAMVEIVARLSSLVFVGEELARNPEWLKIAIDFTWVRVNAVTSLHLWPAPLRPLVHWFFPSFRKLRVLVKEASRLIGPALERERSTKGAQDGAGKSAFTALAWIDEQSNGRRYDATLAQLRLAFAAVHSTTDMLCKLILTLCKHPETIQLLREEVCTVLGERGATNTTLQQLVLMDSVMKESQRLQPVSIATVHRHAAKDVTLPNGIYIPKGTKVALTNTHMSDESIYDNATTFDAHRFVRMRRDPARASAAPFASSSVQHQGFGYGASTCPGRFFVAGEVKVILSLLLLNYDFKLPDGAQTQCRETGFVRICDTTARLSMRRRN
ncbi:cytochrome P450 [Aspergillus heterothallicus]